MPDSTHSSDQIIREASRSLAEQQAGGTHRKSIGRGSARLKFKHWLRKARNIALGVGGLWVAASVIGYIIGGLNFGGLIAVFVGTLVALYLFGKYPKMKVPKRADLRTDDVKQMVARTELWLEHQRSALPKPAAKTINVIGVQLDELQRQLEEVDQQHPTAKQIRKLVGEDLPEMIEGYRKIPENLRYEERAGSTPAKQLEEGLGHISREIDSITRQLAQGSLDDLAIRTRYLDYKYGAGPEGDSGVPLPDFDLQKTKSKA